MKKKFNLFLFALLFINFNLTAQDPILVADLNPGSEDGFNLGIRAKTVSNNNTTLFIIRTEETGLEIGVLENGEAEVLLDIYEGTTSSFPRELTVYKDHFYFIARTATTGYKLWKSDGTAAGTQIFDNDGTDVNGLTISENNFLYYFNGNTIFRTDGENIDSVFAGVSFSIAPIPTDRNICSYNDEIAFATKNSNNEIDLYIVENGTAMLKASRPAGSSFPEISGLNQVGEDLMFIVRDPFNADLTGSFIYKNETETIEPYQINGRNFVRMHNFTDKLALAHEFNTGFYILNGIPGEEAFLVNASNVAYAQGAALPRVVYQDKMVFATKPEFFGDYPIQLTDGTLAGTADLHTGSRTPPESILLEGRFAFFLYRYSSNDYRLSYINMGDGTTGTIFDFMDQEFGFVGFPVAVQNEKIYFAANLNPDIGIELYSLDFDLDITSTSEPEPLSYKVNFTDRSFTIHTQDHSSAEVEIFSTSGALLEKMKVNINTPVSLSHHQGFIILHFNVDGEITTRKFIRR